MNHRARGDGESGVQPIHEPAFSGPPALPELIGGWDLIPCDVGLAGPCRMWVPRAPDGLLDDEDVQDRNRYNDAMPYWAWLWDSAPTMARLVGRMEWEPGERVLEVGAGLGLVGLAAELGSGHAIQLTLSDRDPMSLAALAANAAQNGCSGARVLPLPWNSPDPSLAGAFDVILGCDVTYEAQSHGALLETLDHCLAPDGRVLLADPGRSRLRQFMRRATERGFGCVELSDEYGLAALTEAGAFRMLELRRRSRR